MLNSQAYACGSVPALAACYNRRVRLPSAHETMIATLMGHIWCVYIYVYMYIYICISVSTFVLNAKVGTQAFFGKQNHHQHHGFGRTEIGIVQWAELRKPDQKLGVAEQAAEENKERRTKRVDQTAKTEKRGNK